MRRCQTTARTLSISFKKPKNLRNNLLFKVIDDFEFLTAQETRSALHSISVMAHIKATEFPNDSRHFWTTTKKLQNELFMRLSPQMGQANESLTSFFFLRSAHSPAWIYAEKSRLFNQPTSCLSYGKNNAHAASFSNPEKIALIWAIVQHRVVFLHIADGEAVPSFIR